MVARTPKTFKETAFDKTDPIELVAWTVKLFSPGTFGSPPNSPLELSAIPEGITDPDAKDQIYGR
jgi:hypothetical protein